MIPEFPEFKKIELSDQKEVERVSFKFPSYSDFNFVSMWSWDIKGGMRLSSLNDNLVVRFTDYLTGNPFYSFLGENKANETVEELLEFSKKEGLEPKLKLVPEEVTNNLIGSNFDLEFDRDSYDYIYSVSDLSNMHNWTQSSLSKNIRTYIKLCPAYIVKHQLIRETQKDQYIETFRKWAKSKKIENYLKLNEYKALRRIFEIKHDNIHTVSIYVNDLLVGFSIYQILSPDYAISHFAKADITHHCAISDVLNWEEAKILDKQGIKYFNWEQDLGIPGLRQSKEKYRPSFLLKKLTISSKLDQKQS